MDVVCADMCIGVCWQYYYIIVYKQGWITLMFNVDNVTSVTNSNQYGLVCDITLHEHNSVLCVFVWKRKQ